MPLSFDLSSVANRAATTAVPVVRFAELVRKTGTSKSLAFRTRKKSARKKLNRIIKEQNRYAKATNLHAVALTLTYRNVDTFSPKHISALLGRLRRVLKRMGFSF